MAIMTRQPKEELVLKMDEHLMGWAFADIKRASIVGDAKLAGFILGACLIDAMAGYYTGVTPKTVMSPITPSERFKMFTSKYMTEYSAIDLWKDLRCGMVHAYVNGGVYSFTHGHPELHRVKGPDRTYVNLENFLDDIVSAYQAFRKDILSNTERFQKASERFESMGIMGAVTVFSVLP